MRLLKCTGPFAVRGGPLYMPGEVAAFDDRLASELLSEHPDFWVVHVRLEAATPITVAPQRAPADKMLRSPERRKGRA